MSTIASHEVTCVNGHHLPSALADDWNRLAGEIPCRRWEWLEPWWRHYRRPGDELFLLIVHDEQSRAVAIAPWYISRSLRQGRVVRFLGSGDVCSDYLTVFCEPDHLRQASEQIADHLCTTADQAWDTIELAGVLAGDDAIDCLTENLSQRGLVVHQTAGESCWRMDLPADWEAYVKKLSKTRRERTRQIVRNVFDSGRADSRRLTDAALLPKYFDVLVELHQKRRKSLGQSGCFVDCRFRDYHREVMERLFALDRLRLQYVLLEGKPIAIEYGLVGGNTIYFYQSGIETDVLEERPGWVGTIGSIRTAIAEGYQAYDFMRGDEPYKASWRAEPRQTFDVRIVARRPAAQFRHNAWLAQRQMKRWAKARLRKRRNSTQNDS